MRKTILIVLLSLLSCVIFAEKTVPLPGLAYPHQVAIDDDSFYVVDGTLIYIYSFPEFKLKKKFGHQGEGPGEFKRYALITIQPDHLLINSLTRISFYTKNGDFLKEKNALFNPLGAFLPLGDLYVNTTINREEKRLFYKLNLYDKDLKMVKTLCHLTRNEQQSGMKINALDWGYPKFRTNKDIVVCEELDTELFIFDKEGNKRLAFTPKDEKNPVTEDYKKRFFEQLKARNAREYERVKSRLQFPEYFPVIRDFVVADNKIFVVTFENKDDMLGVLIYDLDGKFIKKVYFPEIESTPMRLYPFTISNGTLYRLSDNEDIEEWELKISKIE